VSLSSGDEVPHIVTRNWGLRPGEFWDTSAGGLLQQNLPIPDSYIAAITSYSPTASARASVDSFGQRRLTETLYQQLRV
jgi:hypothetical protein